MARDFVMHFMHKEVATYIGVLINVATYIMSWISRLYNGQTRSYIYYCE